MQVHAFFCVNIGAVFEEGSMADVALLSNLVFLLYTVRAQVAQAHYERSAYQLTW